MTDETKPDEGVKTLIDQLKQNNTLAKKVSNNEQFELCKEDLEQFILNNSGQLIQDSIETINTIKQYVVSAPEPEDVHSLAELYKASTGALETLNKILIQNKKSETQVAVKTMDIQSKHKLASGGNTKKITFTRDEIFDKLLNSADVIEAEVTDDATEPES